MATTPQPIPTDLLGSTGTTYAISITPATLDANTSVYTKANYDALTHVIVKAITSDIASPANSRGLDTTRGYDGDIILPGNVTRQSGTVTCFFSPSEEILEQIIAKAESNNSLVAVRITLPSGTVYDYHQHLTSARQHTPITTGEILDIDYAVIGDVLRTKAPATTG